MMVSSNLSSSSVEELLILFADILDELKKRGVTRSRNNPVADYAEWLVARKLDLNLEGRSTSGFDARSRDGVRYQIKTRRLDATNKSRLLGVIRNYEKNEFDYLVGILFNRDFKVVKTYKIPHECIKDHSRFSEHQNGHLLHLSGKILEDHRVEDITNKFK
jgi:hypothetical protein